MKVFISHSHKDEALAKKVAVVLEEAGLDVWDPSREIMPGDNWAEKIGQALEESEAMVVLLTPEALETQWVRDEINYALGKVKYQNRLIPVLVGNPKKFPQENIPWILKRLKMINLPEQGKDEESIKQIAQALKEEAA